MRWNTAPRGSLGDGAAGAGFANDKRLTLQQGRLRTTVPCPSRGSPFDAREGAAAPVSEPGAHATLVGAAVIVKLGP